jgi:hypothetical protein
MATVTTIVAKTVRRIGKVGSPSGGNRIRPKIRAFGFSTVVI